MEEMRRLPLPSMGDNNRWVPAMMVWGTQEQKRRFIPPCLTGESITWQCFNEPESGSDFAAVNTRAIPDDGGWRINGEKAFITGRFDPDYLITLANTDPRQAPALQPWRVHGGRQQFRPGDPHHAYADGE